MESPTLKKNGSDTRLERKEKTQTYRSVLDLAHMPPVWVLDFGTWETFFVLVVASLDDDVVDRLAPGAAIWEFGGDLLESSRWSSTHEDIFTR